MAGHSKWANIQHRKGKEDAKRGKLFTKLVKEITIASRMGGGDAENNPRLRAAIAAAKSQSMPNDNIKRAIDKGTGKAGADTIEEFTYEGYGPGGVAVLVETMTDNKIRTISEVRHAFSKSGGNMGESNSVAWQFERKGIIEIPKASFVEDEMAELALEAGADDVEEGDENWILYTAYEAFSQVLDYLVKKNIPQASSQLVMLPLNTVEVSGDLQGKVEKMIERLEDLDDVQNVFTNADFSD
jgi:YebC/PmpR family DNA-binding regulatory protein